MLALRSVLVVTFRCALRSGACSRHACSGGQRAQSPAGRSAIAHMNLSFSCLLQTMSPAGSAWSVAAQYYMAWHLNVLVPRDLHVTAAHLPVLLEVVEPLHLKGCVDGVGHHHAWPVGQRPVNLHSIRSKSSRCIPRTETRVPYGLP